MTSAREDTRERTEAPRRILVIDDDEHMRNSLRESLRRRGFDVTVCADGATGVAACQEATFDVVLTDLRMPEVGGIDVCARLQDMRYAAPIVVITAFGSVETAVDAMRHGAFDYITKPFKGNELQVVVEKAIGHGQLLRENRDLRQENTVLRSEMASRGTGVELVGESAALRRVRELIDRYAESDATVLVRGESGVGKEVVARRLHRASPRRERAFVCVNCAALSAGLLESELFGHEKGAFTGADSRREGRFEIAEGGTILLDEVSEIAPGLQAKLLRVLQERTFERVGSSRSVRADVRVLATSNRSLEDEVRAGRFREDLFFRLNVLPIEVPPLRARKEDVPLLVRYFLDSTRRRVGGREKRIDAQSERLLAAYDWPGNVRELANVIERAWVLTDGDIIRPDALPGLRRVETSVQPVVEQTLARPSESVAERQGGEVPAFPSVSLTGPLHGMRLRDVERLLIEDALRRHGGHQKRTASELGIGVRTLRSKIKKWGLATFRTPGREQDEDLDDDLVESDEARELVEVTT